MTTDCEACRQQSETEGMFVCREHGRLPDPRPSEASAKTDCGFCDGVEGEHTRRNCPGSRTYDALSRADVERRYGAMTDEGWASWLAEDARAKDLAAKMMQSKGQRPNDAPCVSCNGSGLQYEHKQNPNGSGEWGDYPVQCRRCSLLPGDDAPMAAEVGMVKGGPSTDASADPKDPRVKQTAAGYAGWFLRRHGLSCEAPGGGPSAMMAELAKLIMTGDPVAPRVDNPDVAHWKMLYENLLPQHDAWARQATETRDELIALRANVTKAARELHEAWVEEQRSDYPRSDLEPTAKLQAVASHVQAAKSGIIDPGVALRRIASVLDSDPCTANPEGK